MTGQIIVPITESSQVGEARRIAAKIAGLAGLRETEQGKVAIIATEMANNLVRHAHDGFMLLQIVQTTGGSAIEMVSLDSGPGIADLDRCLQDGFSTHGTSGNGLGAIRRLSSEFDIHSNPSLGTAILSRVSVNKTASALETPFALGAVSIAMPGESVCGDAWTSRQSEHDLCLMVADGLGHGPLAQDAALAATQSLNSQPSNQPAQVLRTAHQSLCGTRGVAVAVATYDAQGLTMKYAGVGNISGSLSSAARNQGLISHNGILGVGQPKIQEFSYQNSEDGILIMHSDGLQSRWSLENHPGLSTRHPAIIAGVLFRDYRRGRDDTTVIVVRFQLRESVPENG